MAYTTFIQTHFFTGGKGSRIKGGKRPLLTLINLTDCQLFKKELKTKTPL